MQPMCQYIGAWFLPALGEIVAFWRKMGHYGTYREGNSQSGSMEMWLSVDSGLSPCGDNLKTQLCSCARPERKARPLWLATTSGSERARPGWGNELQRCCLSVSIRRRTVSHTT